MFAQKDAVSRNALYGLNVKIDARMFRQWISSGKDESKYYPKEIVSKGILGGNCGRDPAFVSAQFGKGGQEILMNMRLETIEVAIARYEVIQRNSLVRCS